MRKNEQLYSVVEVAEYLSVSPYTVYRWLNSGKMAGYKMSGSKWRVSEQHINDFLVEHEVKEVPLRGEDNED